MQQMLHEVDEVKYVIKVRGVTVSIPFSSKMLAEQHLGNMPMEQQQLAEIVPVTNNGQQILFG